MPLLLLHGFTGAPASWDEVLPNPPPREVLVPRISGHAGEPVAIAGFEDELRRLERLLSGHPIWDLAGYSLGARLVLGLALRHPARCRRLVLISGQPGLQNSDDRARRLDADERWALLLEEGGLQAFIDAWERQPLFESQQTAPEFRRQQQDKIRNAHDARALAAALRALGLARMPNYWPHLAALTCATELVVGALDPKFCAIAAEMRQRCPAVRVEVVPGAGHNLLLEAPTRIRELLFC